MRIDFPIKRMKVQPDGQAVIPNAPLLAAGVWKGIIINEKNLDEVISWQKKTGPIKVVLDHIEDVTGFIGFADKFRKDKRDGIVLIIGDVEIVDKPTIDKLLSMKERGGGFCGISPRLTFEKRMENGEIEGLTTPHIAIVLEPAQGKVTLLSLEGGINMPEEMTKSDLESGIGDIVTEVEAAIKSEQIDAAALKSLLSKVLNELIALRAKEGKEKNEKPEKEADKKYPAPGGKEKYPPYPEYPKEKGKKMMNEICAMPVLATEANKVEENIYEKELLRQGLYNHPKGVGFLGINDKFLDVMILNFRARGNRVPLFVGGHPDDLARAADKVIGHVVDIYRKGNSLFGKFSITNSLVRERIDDKTLRDASAGICLNLLDEQGQEIGPVLTHVSITPTPYLAGLEEFKKLVASNEIGTVAQLNLVDTPEIAELKQQLAEQEKKTQELTSKLAELSERQIKTKEEEYLARIDKLIAAELFKPGMKERLHNLVKKTISLSLDGKQSVAEELISLLEQGTVKGEVGLSQRISVNEKAIRYVTSEEMKDRLLIQKAILEGKIEHDKSGLPYWKE